MGLRTLIDTARRRVGNSLASFHASMIVKSDPQSAHRCAGCSGFLESLAAQWPGLHRLESFAILASARIGEFDEAPQAHALP